MVYVTLGPILVFLQQMETWRDFRMWTGRKTTHLRDQLRHLFSDWQVRESHSVADNRN